MIPLSDTHNSGRFPLVTIGLILLNVALFLLELTTPNLDAFINQFALIPAKVDFNNLFTLVPFITSMFLHGGFLHIGSNMLFLWVFGDNVEEAFGWFYLPFYLIGGIAASLTQYFLDTSSSIPTLGASGAVAAVLGAYFILFPHHKVKTLIFAFFLVTIVEVSAPFLLLYWFALQIISGIISIGDLSSGGIAWFAHIGGFLTGVFYALIMRNTAEKG